MTTKKDRLDNSNSPNLLSKSQGDERNESKINIMNFDIYEQERTINSPKSLLASKLLGIKPQEILFMPIEKYENPRVSNTIASMRFEAFEKKRLDLIELIKRKRNEIILASEGLTIPGVPNLIKASSMISISAKKSKDKLKIKETFNEMVKKAKLKEMKIIERQLRVEEVKNKQFEEKITERMLISERDKEEEKRRNLEKKLKAVEKIERDKQIRELQKLEEKEQRKESQLMQLEQMKNREIEIKKEKERMQKKEEELFKAELKRQRKLRKAELLKQILIEEKKKKAEEVNKKSEEIIIKINKKKEEQKEKLVEKKEKFEFAKEKIKTNLANEEIKKRENFNEKLMREEELERKLTEKKLLQYEKNRIKALTKSEKIHKAIEEANKIKSEKKLKIMERQRLEELRLEEIKRKEEEMYILKTEGYKIKNDLLKVNASHKKEKDGYFYGQIKEKLAADEYRSYEFQSFKEEMQKKRVDNQLESCFQRELMKEALYQMSVWNVYDVDIIQEIISNPNKYINGPTLEELIRKKAVQNSKANSNALSFVSNKHNRSLSVMRQNFSLDSVIRKGVDEENSITKFVTQNLQRKLEFTPNKILNQSKIQSNT